MMATTTFYQDLSAFVVLVLLGLVIIHWSLRMCFRAIFFTVGWLAGGPDTEVQRLVKKTPVDTFGQVVRLPPSSGSGVGENRHLPITAGMAPARLRARARWARRCECLLRLPRGELGKLVRGRWTPDLPSASRPAGLNVLLSHFADGAILLGGGEVQKTSGGTHTYYVLQLSDGDRVTLVPELLSRLSAYALLRQRDAVLLSSLRLRALDWCKSEGLSPELRMLLVADSLRSVFELSPVESRLGEFLEGFESRPPRWFQRS